MNIHAALRAASVGASTGGRTFTGLATLIATTPQSGAAQPDTTLGKPWLKALTGLAAVQELVMDKLPQTPSRLHWAPLTGRALAAAGAGAIVGERDAPAPHSAVDDEDADRVRRERRVDMILGALLAAGVAVGASWLGVRGRAWCAGRFGNDYVGAALEDALVVGLAAAAARTG